MRSPRFTPNDLTRSHRFRQVPVFGDSAVRQFSNNVSEMKRLQGHDYENIIQVSTAHRSTPDVANVRTQCIMPCIDGLLPEPRGTTVLSMLFVLGTWHALAKLRMHADSSLKLLDDATTCLGIALRYFTRVTCPASVNRVFAYFAYATYSILFSEILCHLDPSKMTIWTWII